MFPDPGIWQRLGKFLVRKCRSNAVAVWFNGYGVLHTQSVCKSPGTLIPQKNEILVFGKEETSKVASDIITEIIIFKGVWKAYLSRVLFMYSQDFRVGNISEDHLAQTLILCLKSANNISDNGRQGREFVLNSTRLAKMLISLGGGPQSPVPIKYLCNILDIQRP